MLPVTIQFGTWCAGDLNSSGKLRIASSGHGEFINRDLLSSGQRDRTIWANYPIGVVDSYLRAGVQIEGMDLLFYSDIPGSGLSSSASFCVATALMVQSLTGYSFSDEWQSSRWKIAEICQRVEHEYLDVNCGIMDPAAIALAKGNNALQIDCSQTESARSGIEYVPCNIDPYRFVIVDSGKKRKLAASAYNRRVKEIGQILELIQAHEQLQQLCQLKIDDLARVRGFISDDTLYKRCHHVVTENQRVTDAISALRHNDVNKFGELMLLSHASLRNDYEVSSIELDTLVSASTMQEGVLGARMTGAGFGGCIISLVHRDAIDSYKDSVSRLYKDKCGCTAEFYIVQTGSDCLV